MWMGRKSGLNGRIAVDARELPNDGDKTADLSLRDIPTEFRSQKNALEFTN